MVDVSAQASCTVTPINPTTLTTAGGVFNLPNGTENVIIRCNCSYNDGYVITNARWWYLDGIIPPRVDSGDDIPSTPYYTRASGDTNNRNITLVIPTFNDSYDGNYICGRRRGGSPRAPTVTVSLTIGGELFVETSLIV